MARPEDAEADSIMIRDIEKIVPEEEALRIELPANIVRSEVLREAEVLDDLADLDILVLGSKEIFLDGREGIEVGSVDRDVLGGEEKDGLAVRGFRVNSVVGTAREGVGFALLFAGAESEDVVVGREELVPTSLAPIENFEREEVLEVLVVSEDESRIIGAFEVGTEVLESLDNGEELFVVDFVVELGRSELARVEGDWVEEAVFALGDDGAASEVGGVGLKNALNAGLEEDEDGSRGEGGFERFEGGDGGFVALERNGLLGEFGEGLGDLGVS